MSDDDFEDALDNLRESIARLATNQKGFRKLLRSGPFGRVFATIGALEIVSFVAEHRDLDELRERNPSFYYLACATKGAKDARNVPQVDRWMVLCKAFSALERHRKTKERRAGSTAGNVSASIRNEAGTLRRNVAAEAYDLISKDRKRGSKQSKEQRAKKALETLKYRYLDSQLPKNGKALLARIGRELGKRPE